MFITFEGIDFCGKSTQVNLLEKYLVENNKRVKIIREPGGTTISEKIRDILLDRKNDRMFIETEILLFSSSRAQLVREVINPFLKDDFYVVSDRFYDSTTAYQGFGRSMDLNIIESINSFAVGSAIPDITFFIDIPVEESAKRKALVSKNKLDRIEISDNEFYERVRVGYLHLANTERRFRIINGLLSIEEIHKMIINEIKKEKTGLERQL